MAAVEPGSAEQASFYADQARASTWVVTVIGEVDLAHKDRFQAVVDRALRASPAKLIFDVAGVRFMDSSGLNVLLSALRSDVAVEVRAASPAMRRLIEITGLTGVLTLSD